MIVRIFEDKRVSAQAAAVQAANRLRQAIAARGQARIIAATGTSQFEFLEALTSTPGIDWSRVEAFHLDEYVGIPATHPASFRKILLERLVKKTGIPRFHGLAGDAANPLQAARDVGQRLAAAAVDVAFLGIGENGHIAFNDPPADFVTEEPYLLVDLDEACRRQQVGEGWFASLADVPTKAISMSPRQILKAQALIVVVPDLRKAQAVRNCLESEISPMVPASILRTHPDATVYLDTDSASLLSEEFRRSVEAESRT